MSVHLNGDVGYQVLSDGSRVTKWDLEVVVRVKSFMNLGSISGHLRMRYFAVLLSVFLHSFVEVPFPWSSSNFTLRRIHFSMVSSVGSLSLPLDRRAMKPPGTRSRCGSFSWKNLFFSNRTQEINCEAQGNPIALLRPSLDLFFILAPLGLIKAHEGI